MSGTGPGGNGVSCEYLQGRKKEGGVLGCSCFSSLQGAAGLFVFQEAAGPSKPGLLTGKYLSTIKHDPPSGRFCRGIFTVVDVFVGGFLQWWVSTLRAILPRLHLL